MRIGVVMRPDNEQARLVARRLSELAAQRDLLVGSVTEHSNGADFESDRLSNSDVIVAIGGDGTVLEAVRYALPNDAPVVGINVGRVGFLAEAEADDLGMG